MSDYYHHFLTSMSGVGGNPTTSPQDGHPPPIPGSHLSVAGGAMPNPYQNLGYFTGFPDPIMFNAPKSQKARRKSASGLDHVKHRRTRSGCYMCRSRRVKCDETRPVCDRCKKGNRECVYPEPPGPKGSTSQSATSRDSSSLSQQASPNSSNEEEEDEFDHDVKLESIPDEDEEPDGMLQQRTKPFSIQRRTSTTSSLNLHRMGTRNSSETPSQDENKSSSPSVSTGTTSSQATTTYQGSEQAMQSLSRRVDWSHLPPDFQHYLNYFCENLTNYHYCLLNDADDFFRVILPNMAVRNEALLYAVVGFAAYHSTLQDPNGRIQEFLRYYNRSVTLLLNFLKRKEKHTIATLLTILQLATIEEYLGDWVNLMGHQKAAFEILTQLFTPQSAMQSPLGRMIVAWYSRFDVFVALMGGFPTALPREWFVTFVDYCHSQAASAQEPLNWKMEAESGRLRFISMEMSMLFAKRSKGDVSPQEFAMEHDRLAKALEDWKTGWDREITDPAHLVTDFSWGRPLDADDIVNPYVPGILYDFPIFPTTLMISEWHSTMVMHKCQSTTTPRDMLFADLGQHAYGICQIFEAVERWPYSPKGSLVLIQACVAIGALFLPPDARHRMWIRKKFALIETMGYIHPITLRAKMAELFQEPSCVRWWLPNDEGFSPILQNVRTFADERNAAAVSAQAENLREVRHIFANLELGDDDDAGGDAKGKGKA